MGPIMQLRFSTKAATVIRINPISISLCFFLQIFDRLDEEDDDFGFHQLAKSGAMDKALYEWPV